MHILVLHIPVGVILLAVIADWVSARSRFAGARQVATLLWGVGAVTAVLSVVSGLMHAAEGGFDAGNIGSHRFYAILTAVGSLAVWFLRAKGSEAVAGIAKGVGLVTLVALLLTLHYGSRVTHGDRFLQVSVASAGVAPVASRVAETAGIGAATTELVTALGTHGLNARPVARNVASLSVATVAPGTALDPAAFAALGEVADRVVELNLSRADLPDGALETVASLTALTALRLDNASIGDAELAALAQLPDLRVLNLHGNSGITNSGVEALAAIPALERVYVWGTSIDAAGIETLEAARPGLVVQGAEAFPAGLVAAND